MNNSWSYYTSQLALLERYQLPPSSATWDILYSKEWLPDIAEFLTAVDIPAQVPDGRCKAAPIETNVVMVKNSLPTSEKYSFVICANIISHVVNELNQNTGGLKLYRLDAEPSVQEENDARNNKRADFSILKIRNKRTYVIVEVKLSVPETLSSREKNDLAQLFLEIIYCCRKEKINRMLAILTNGFIWHTIALDTRFPITFENYFRIKIKPENTPKDICNTLTHYILTEQGLQVSSHSN